jgi:hypothetical protein
MNNKVPKFQQICYILNSLHLFALAAGMRWLAFKIARPEYRDYGIQDQAGYLGWFGTPQLGCLAFKREDQTIQFRW